MSGDVLSDHAVLARHGSSFRFAGRLLGPDLFDRAAGLYAVCRAVDDLADEHPDPLAAARILRELGEDLRGGRVRTPLGDRLRALHVDPAAAVELVETMLSDLGTVRVPDEAALLRYAYGAAGTVGLMMCDVLGTAHPAARRHAVDLGIAMQLTNIARDVREDALRNRIYLPATWLWDGIAPAELLGGDPARIFHSVRLVLTLADRHYDSGLRGLRFLDSRGALAVSVAAARYRAIGRTILRCGPAFLDTPRFEVPRATRCLVVLRCLADWATGTRDVVGRVGER